LTVQHARERSTGDDALNDLRAEMHWRLYRAAKKENKPGEASKNLDGLLSLNPRRADVVLEVVPALKEAKRVDDARALFARAYTPLKAAVDENPEDAEAANNLAWLCARCEEKLDEAEALSTKAVAKVPNNPAYLDTAAEAQFRLGRAEKAVELETKALQLRPGDEFMQQQLKRFEAGNRKE
jgi:tetratricopeptide (TPR) repeat protein